MGTTSKVPKWQLAYNYPPERKETLLKDIVCQVGRTGVINTYGNIKNQSKVAVQQYLKSTLHNENFIKEKGLKIGDTVIIQKAEMLYQRLLKQLFLKNCEKKILKCQEYAQYVCRSS